jgi:hypothetical protein
MSQYGSHRDSEVRPSGQRGHDFLSLDALAAHLPQPEPMASAARLATLTALVCAAASGCSAGEHGTSEPFGGGSFTVDATAPQLGSGTPGGGNGSVLPGDGSLANLPQEMKTESDYQSPVATGVFVWTANPTSGRVAYIDARSFTVQTVQAGDGPTYLAAVPSPSGTDETAIVLNVLSHDATLLRHDSSTGATTTMQYPSTKDANSWSVSPSGRWAVAWTDATKVTNADATQGFQDMAVLDINPPPNTQPLPPTLLAVGYRPSQIAYSLDETRAFAVTQDGITVIDLSGSQPVASQNFPLSAPVDLAAQDAAASDGGAAEAATGDAPFVEDSSAAAPDATTTAAPSAPASGMPDVSFTTDGAYALVRQDGVAAITVVSLKDGSPVRIDLPAAPTDLTVAPDGTFAVAVLRDLSSVAILPLPQIASDPSSFTMTEIPGEIIGRAIVAEDLTTKETSVLLFTTVVAVDHLTVLTLQPTPSYRTIALHAPVLAVFPTSDAQNAIVLHNVTPAPNSPVKGAYSIVPIAKALPAKIVSVTAPPTAVALAPSGDRALVTMSDTSAIYEADLAIMPSLDVLPYTLASPPTAAGIAAAAGMGFVAQSYPDGRITFIDLAGEDGGAARTITGFELSARVVQSDSGTP